MNDTDIDKLSNLLEDVAETAPNTNYEKAMPKNKSWLIIDGDRQHIATDSYYTIDYDDGVDMKQKFIDFIKTAVPSEIFNMIRTGELRNLTFRLGPDSGSGGDLYEEYGNELNYAETSNK